MARFHTTDPTTGELVEEFEGLTQDEIEPLLTRAHAGYLAWRRTDVAERAEVLHRIADLYDERAEQLAQDVTREMGKPITAARGEMKTVAGIFRYYAEQGPEMIAREQIEPATGGTAYVRRDPIGVLLMIMPWNFPIYQVARFAAPNLVLGNTVLLKHAEITPECAQLVQDLLDEAGITHGRSGLGSSVLTMVIPRLPPTSAMVSERSALLLAPY